MDSIGQWATQRVLEGIRQYGVIDLIKDKRCFIRKAVEELLDAKNYITWANGKNQIHLDDFRHLDKAIDLMVKMLMKSCSLNFLNLREEKEENRNERLLQSH